MVTDGVVFCNVNSGTIADRKGMENLSKHELPDKRVPDFSGRITRFLISKGIHFSCPLINRMERDAGEIFLLGLFFFASRLLFYWVGIRFDIGPLYYFAQFADLDLLRYDLLRTVTHLHMQPPLFNLFTGIVLKLFPGSFVAVFSTIHLFIGFLVTVSLNRGLRAIGMAPFWRIGIPLFMAISPSFILAENWFFYTWPVLGLLSVAMWAVSNVDRPRWWVFFGVLVILVLTRSLFHLLFIAGFTVLVLLRNRKQPVLWPAVVAIVLVTAFYGANLARFGFFGSSSWLGMSLAKMTVWHIPPDELNGYISGGRLSPLSKVPPFSPLEEYGAARNPGTGIPILDRIEGNDGKPNFNNLNYIDISSQLDRDSRTAILLRPDIYIKKVLEAIFIFHTPGSDNSFFVANRRKIRLYSDLWDTLVNGQFLSGRQYSDFHARRIAENPIDALKYTRFFLLLATGLVLILSVHAVFRSRNPLILFCAFLFLYIAVVGNLLEVGENNRFRMLTSPAMLVLLFYYASRIPLLRRIFFSQA